MHRTIEVRCGFEMMEGDGEVLTEVDEVVVVEVGWLGGPGTGFLLDFFLFNVECRPFRLPFVRRLVLDLIDVCC